MSIQISNRLISSALMSRDSKVPFMSASGQVRPGVVSYLSSHFLINNELTFKCSCYGSCLLHLLVAAERGWKTLESKA